MMAVVEPLFQPRQRTNPSPKGHLEEEFAFLDRVRSRFFAEVRRVLNRWFEDYPAAEREELRRRLRSGDERESHAAFWELLLYKLYTGAGFDVSVHPEVEGTTRRPDFLLERDGKRVLMEARFATGASERKRKQDRRRRALYQAVDRARPDDFKVKLDIKRDGPQQPPVRAIVDQLEAWLATLDADAVAAALQQDAGFHVPPMLPVSVSGWELEFRALPLKRERRGTSGRMLSVFPTETYAGDPATTVRAALKAKGRRYGTPPYPLVIALAIEEPWLHDEDIQSALYGQTIAYVSPGDEPLAYAHGRRDDGYWSGRREAGRRVSAVVTARSVRPWLAASRVEPRIWLNPWAEKLYDLDRVWAWTAPAAESGEFATGPAARSTAELLGLPPDWPPGQAFGPGDADDDGESS